MTVTARRADHADKTVPVPGANPRFTIRRHLDGYSYPTNGNHSNPTPHYRWTLHVDGKLVDQDAKKGALVAAARINGMAYLRGVDGGPDPEPEPEDETPVTLTADRAMFDAASHRLALALTESPEKRDPALLLAQLLTDMGGTVPVEWHQS